MGGLVCGACHLEFWNFEKFIYFFVYYLIKKGNVLQFRYWNHPTFSKTWKCPKMCFTAYQKCNNKIIRYSTFDALSKLSWVITLDYVINEQPCLLILKNLPPLLDWFSPCSFIEIWYFALPARLFHLAFSFFSYISTLSLY